MPWFGLELEATPIRIPIRVAIRITFSAQLERDAIHREYPLRHAFLDH